MVGLLHKVQGEADKLQAFCGYGFIFHSPLYNLGKCGGGGVILENCPVNVVRPGRA